MSAHLSQRELEQYRRGVLPPADLLVADDHLAACSQCRARLGETVPAADAWQTLRASLPSAGEQPEHLSYEQLAAYADEKLSGMEREAAASHLEICRMCAAEMRDLQDFSATMGALVARDREPATRATWAEFWRGSFLRLPRLASASLLVILIFLLAVTLLRRRETSSTTDIANTSPTAAIPSPPPTSDTINPAEKNLLALNDGGGRVTLDAQGRLTAPRDLPPAYEQLIKKALTTGRVETPQLAALTRRSEVLMGGASEGVPFALLGPVAAVINTERPAFRWQPLTGAESYVVKVYDSNYKRVAASHALSTNEWSLPQSLARGGVYSWQVTAVRNRQEVASPTPPAPEARFKVLEQAKADELERARGQFADSHLTMGLLYAQAGLLDEAGRELQALVDANRDSPLARKLLRSVKTLSR